MDYDKLGYAKASTYRTEVIKAIDGPVLPSELEEQTDIEQAHVSRALNELREEGVTELLVSEDTKKGRLYGLTEEGEDIKEAL